VRDIVRYRNASTTPSKLDPVWKRLDERLADLQAYLPPLKSPPAFGDNPSLELWFDKLASKLFKAGEAFGVSIDRLYRMFDKNEESEGKGKQEWGDEDERLKKWNRTFWLCVRDLCTAKLEGGEPLLNRRATNTMKAFAEWNRGVIAEDTPVSRVQVSEIESHLVNVDETKCLGEGSFGKVYEATYGGATVAVKKMHLEFVGRKARKLMEEARHHCAVNHPNVVHFIGVCPPPEFCLVMECAPPSLRGALDVMEEDVSLGQMFVAALQLARGMEAVHKAKIVHGDLRAMNVLVGPRGPSRRCRVTDFGMSVVKTATSTARTTGTLGRRDEVTGNYHWEAPEIAQGGNRAKSDKTDVFSFGIVLYQIVSGGEVPYDGAIRESVVGHYRNGANDSVFDPGWPEEYRKLMRDCMREDPMHRPSFAKIIERILSVGVADDHLELK